MLDARYAVVSMPIRAFNGVLHPLYSPGANGLIGHS